ncbi:PPC domain-containing protein [Paludisphaera borealis]|uniref:Putative subtilase-type serine protease n=1 Tax=Paludisphaera borealis TaxID=1387353 RepID=A0A1U7CT21_9BACT|nr:PPC domain-containing protein [Paludisphaera borealis]APW62058.1 putative subtilase-type serine protease [Paludisphaera borealis]
MRRRSLTASLFSIALLVASVPNTWAKAPALTGFFPAGAARGQSLTVTMSGKFDHWPVKCWVEGAGLSVKPGEVKGKLSVEVAADAQPGVRWVRVYDEEGATSLRPFIVGALPEAMESEPNDDPRRPQAIEHVRTTVNGRLSRSGDVDGYSVKLERGQRLAADLEANRHLGSPMDAVLQIVSAEGFVLAQNNDTVGLDPRIIFEAPATGTYLVRVFAFPSAPDSSIHFAGGDAFVYRLTLTTGGFIEHAFPLAVSRESPTAITAIGSNIAGSDSVLVVPSDDRRDLLSLTHPSLAGTAEIRRVTGAMEVEVEPNEPAKPQVLSDHGSVSGRIDPPGDRDAYLVAMKKGEKRLLRLESRTFGLPLDAVLQVLGGDGKTLAETDDVGDSSDPELAFTPSADGDFRVVVRDLNRRGGPHHAYLLSVIAPEPDLVLTLAADMFEVTPGKETKIVVAIARKDGFGDTIAVTAEDLPDGVQATTALSRPSDASAKSVTLEFRSGASPQPGPFRIVARSADGRGRQRTALAKITGFEVETDRPWLTILPAPKPKSP